MADGIEISITEDVTTVEVTEDVTTINITPSVTNVEARGIALGSAGSATSTTYQGLSNTFGTGGNVAASLDHINANGFNKNANNTIDGNTTVAYDRTFNFESGAPVKNAMNLGNNNITGVNHISFADAGAGEGLRWENIQIVETNDGLTANSPGDLQITYKQDDNSYARRFTVRDTGVDVVGTITFDGGTTSADLNFGDGDKAVFGASENLKIYFDGNHSYVYDTGPGDLRVRGNNLYLQNDTGGNYLSAINGGATTLFYNGNTTLATTADGAAVTGDLSVSGQLGIGTIDTGRQLHIKGSGDTVAVKIEATDGVQSSLDLKNSEGEFRLINDNGELSIYDQTDTAERFRIDTAGDISTAGTVTATGFSGPITGNVTGNVTGQVSDISNHSTTELAEGTNLYYTTARFDTAFEGKTTSDLTEGDNEYYTSAKADARVNSVLGSGVDNIVTTGYLRGPSTFTIDPAGHGDNTGKVVIAGDLQVDGTTTTINSTELTIDDKTIVVAANATDAADAHNAGLQIAGADASLVYSSLEDNMQTNKDFKSQGSLQGASIKDTSGDKGTSGQALFSTGTGTNWVGISTSDVSENESNLYYTNTRVRNEITGAALDMGANNITTTGKVLFSNVYAAEVDLPDASTYHGMFAHVHGTGKGYFAHGGSWHKLLDESSSTTDNLSEGSSNVYYTDTRVDSKLAAGVSNIVTTGYLRGPASFTIDPVTHGDDTGTVVIAGDLQVDGETTTINSTTLDITTLEVTLAKGAQDASQANGAGINIDGVAAKITYNGTNNRWDFNRTIKSTADIQAQGDISGVDLSIQDITSTGDFSTTGDVSVGGVFKDSNDSAGTTNQVLSSTATGTSWINSSGVLNILTDSSNDGDDTMSIDLSAAKLDFAGGTGIDTNHDTSSTVSIGLETVSGLSAGQYGAASTIPQITVDTTGRVTAISTITGQSGPRGPEGATTFTYIFEDDTAWNSGNPGYRRLKSNQANLTNTTQFNISYRMDDPSDSANAYIDIADFIKTVADGDDAPTSTIKGHFRLAEQSDPSNFVLYEITGGANNDAAVFSELEVNYLAGTVTSFSDNEPLFTSFARTGDAGSGGSGGSSSLTIQDEGSALATAATTLNFVGSGVTAEGTAATKTITISGGGSADEVTDADADTKIQVEESADEDIIRFDVAGTELMTLDANELELKSTDLKLTGSGTGSDLSSTISPSSTNSVTAWKNTGKSSSTGIDQQVHSVYLSPNGTTLVFNTDAETGDSVVKQTLSTAFDISTAGSTVSDGIMSGISSNQETVFDLTFSNDGSKSFALTEYNGSYERQLVYCEPSTAFGPDFGSTVNLYYWMNGMGAASNYIPNSIDFSTDGTKVFFGGYSRLNSSDFYVWSYSLSNAFDISDISTSTSTGRTVNVSMGTSAVNLTSLLDNKNIKIKSLDSVKFSSDGKTFYILDSVLKNIRSFTLSTAWDLTSTVTSSGSQKISVIESTPKALCVDTANNIALISGLISEKITQFSLDHSTLEVVSEATSFDGTLFAAGALQIDGDINLTQNLNSSNSLSERTRSGTSLEIGSSFIVEGQALANDLNTIHSVDLSNSSEVNFSANANGNAPPYSVYLPGHKLKTGDRVLYSSETQGNALYLTINYAIVTGDYVQFGRRLVDAIAIPPIYRNLQSSSITNSDYSGQNDHTFKELKSEVKIGGQDIEIGDSPVADSKISISNVGGTLTNNYINLNDRASPLTTSHINIGNQGTANTQNVNIGSAQGTTSQSIDLYGQITLQGSSRGSGDSTHNRSITIGGQYTKGTITLGKSDLTNTINIGSSITAGNTQNINIGTSSAGTTNINLGKFTLPTSDGSANQVLKTDGNGNLDFVDQSGGGSVRTVSTANANTLTGTLLDSEDLVLKEGTNISIAESGGVVTFSAPETPGAIDIIAGSLSDTQFKAKDGKRLLKVSSGGSYEYNLFQPTAADIGKSWTVINADSSGSSSFSGILIDSNGQRVRFMSGSTNYAFSTSLDATVHRGGIAEIVCIAANANGGTTQAPNFIIYGSGIVVG